MIKKLKLLIIILMISSIFSKSYSEYEKKFYDHNINLIDGSTISLKKFENKVILLVNVASYCGFTKQYTDLQNIYEKYKDKGFIVLGVPSRSFNQEMDNEKEIKKFCEVNFNITFPMTSILDVKGDNAHDIYKWAKANYGKSAVPKWNFHKILINKSGKIDDTYSSFTKPNSNKIINRIESLLK